MTRMVEHIDPEACNVQDRSIAVHDAEVMQRGGADGLFRILSSNVRSCWCLHAHCNKFCEAGWLHPHRRLCCKHAEMQAGKLCCS